MLTTCGVTQAIKQAIKQVAYIAYVPHKSLAPLFDSSPAINAPQNLGILLQANSMVRSPDPLSATTKKNGKKRSGYARLLFNKAGLNYANNKMASCMASWGTNYVCLATWAV